MFKPRIFLITFVALVLVVSQDAFAGMAGAIIGPLEVAPVRNTSIVEIAYIASTPRLAQKVTEAVGDTYMRLNTEQKYEAVKRMISTT